MFTPTPTFRAVNELLEGLWHLGGRFFRFVGRMATAGFRLLGRVGLGLLRFVGRAILALLRGGWGLARWIFTREPVQVAIAIAILGSLCLGGIYLLHLASQGIVEMVFPTPTPHPIPTPFIPRGSLELFFLDPLHYCASDWHRLEEISGSPVSERWITLIASGEVLTATAPSAQMRVEFDTNSYFVSDPSIPAMKTAVSLSEYPCLVMAFVDNDGFRHDMATVAFSDGHWVLLRDP